MRCQIKILEEKSNRDIKKWHQEDQIKLCEAGAPCSTEHKPKQERVAGTPGIEQMDVSQRPPTMAVSRTQLLPGWQHASYKSLAMVQMAHLVSRVQLVHQNLCLLWTLWLMCIPSWLWVWQLIIFQNFILHEKTRVCVLSCVQLFVNPMDCSLPGSSVHGTFQARILEQVAISYVRRSSRPRE